MALVRGYTYLRKNNVKDINNTIFKQNEHLIKNHSGNIYSQNIVKIRNFHILLNMLLLVNWKC